MVVNIKSALLNTTNTRQIFTMALEFNFESMVRGYHVYKDVWDATIRETLPCKVESGNASDPYAVALKQGSTIAGHVNGRAMPWNSTSVQKNQTRTWWCGHTQRSNTSSDRSWRWIHKHCMVAAGSYQKQTRRSWLKVDDQHMNFAQRLLNQQFPW